MSRMLENMLALQARQGCDAARAELVQAMMPNIRRLLDAAARGIRPRRACHVNDFVGFGVEHVLRQLARWDPGSPTATDFRQFALYSLRYRARDAMLAERFNLARHQYRYAAAHPLVRTVRLDARPQRLEDGASLGERLESAEIDPLAALIAAEERQVAVRALGTLSGLHQELIRASYRDDEPPTRAWKRTGKRGHWYAEAARRSMARLRCEVGCLINEPIGEVA